MLQHYVFIKYVAGTSQEHVEEFCRRMQALPRLIPSINRLQIGLDVLHDARSWDVLLSMRFTSIEALRQYQEHPAHQQVMAFNQAMVAQVGSVDFWMS